MWVCGDSQWFGSCKYPLVRLQCERVSGSFFFFLEPGSKAAPSFILIYFQSHWFLIHSRVCFAACAWHGCMTAFLWSLQLTEQPVTAVIETSRVADKTRTIQICKWAGGYYLLGPVIVWANCHWGWFTPLLFSTVTFGCGVFLLAELLLQHHWPIILRE